MFREGKRYAKLGTSETDDIEMGRKASSKTVSSSASSHSGSTTAATSAAPSSSSPYTKNISFWQLMQVLRPFFWPASGSDGAFLNRLRATSTWVVVLLSKGCNLFSPLFIATSTNNLANGDLHSCVVNLLIFIFLRFSASVFKECQSILYIRVKQEASIQLQELTFRHLHTLSLNWHLSKRTGTVMKSMDRGVGASDTIVTYLFLFLIPSIIECLSVMILFFIKFKQWRLGMVVLVGIICYSIATIILSTYRKRFREETNKHDNDFHDKATDSIINYETVKYFTGEEYEISRYTSSVRNYQKSNSSTQYSLSALNISQQLFVNLTMLGAMYISAVAVKQGTMTLGDWIAVQTWVVTIFAPLNFLGSLCFFSCSLLCLLIVSVCFF
jgi:ABC-type multidrug transport system fused ATPase/permease subunit